MPIFPTGYTQKTTPADDDQVLIGDSAASNAIKKTKISSIITKATAAAVAAVGALTNWITTAMLQNTSVTKAKVNFGSGIWWEELARVSIPVGSPASSIDTGVFTKKKYLKIIFTGYSSGGTYAFGLRFNNDSGNNYSDALIYGSGASVGYSQSGPSAQIRASTTVASTGSWLFDALIYNDASRTKQVSGHGTSDTNAGVTAGYGPDNQFFSGKWVNSTTQIERIQFIKLAGTSGMGQGSEVIVLGHD